ncbi:hypothetical protein AAG906_004458 [Vitis piasezkii]
MDICATVCFLFYLSFIGFSDAPHHSLCTLVDHLVLRVLRNFTIGNPLGCRGSACVEVMTTLHGSAPFFRRCAESCVPSEGMIASARDPLKSIPLLFRATLTLVGSVVIGLVTFIVVSYIFARDWTSVGLLLGYFSAYLIYIPCGVSLTPYLMKYFHYFRSIDTFDAGSTSWILRSDQRDIDSQIVTVDQFAAAMTLIQEAIASLDRKIDGPVTWDDFDGLLVANLPTKFRKLEIERYTDIGCLCIHLRLYSTIMRAHGLDKAQMIMFFPMSLSGAAQRWFASLDFGYPELGPYLGPWVPSLDSVAQFRPIIRAAEVLIVLGSGRYDLKLESKHQPLKLDFKSKKGALPELKFGDYNLLVKG